MRKSFIFLFLAIVSLVSYAQNSTIYSKKGVAIDGYDVVSYFENNPKKGSKEYQTKYNEVTFLFSSQEHLDLFTKTPKKYLPQYGGYCAYGVAAKNKKFPINPETYEIRDDKLYLFYNAWGTNTLTSWQQEKPVELVKKGDENWKNQAN